MLFSEAVGGAVMIGDRGTSFSMPKSQVSSPSPALCSHSLNGALPTSPSQGIDRLCLGPQVPSEDSLFRHLQERLNAARNDGTAFRLKIPEIPEQYQENLASLSKEMRAYLDSVSSSLSSSAGLQPPVAIVVLNEGSSNAFCEDGRIYVTAGLIHQFTEPELIACLAHEVGHYLNGDFYTAQLLAEEKKNLVDGMRQAGVPSVQIELAKVNFEKAADALRRQNELRADHSGQLLYSQYVRAKQPQFPPDALRSAILKIDTDHSGEERWKKNNTMGSHPSAVNRTASLPKPGGLLKSDGPGTTQDIGSLIHPAHSKWKDSPYYESLRASVKLPP
jgi:Peptidase family M48